MATNVFITFFSLPLSSSRELYKKATSEKNENSRKELSMHLGIAEIKLSGLLRRIMASIDILPREKVNHLDDFNIKISNIRGWKKRAIDFEKAKN